MAFDQQKFKTMIHYIIASVENPSDLGAVKLNKIAWFIDGMSFKNFGRTMTGATYMKQPQGPVPRAMVPVMRELASEGKITVEDVRYFGRTKKQYISQLAVDKDQFTVEEMSLIDEITKLISQNFTGAEVSEITHSTAWKVAKTGENIPFNAYLVDDFSEITEKDIEWAKAKVLESAA